MKKYEAIEEFSLVTVTKEIGVRILIVDDDESIRTTLACLFDAYNHQYVMASNGVEALERLDDSIDAVVTDLMMPKMGGIELVKNLKERQFNKKIIMMTGTPEHIPPGYKVIQKPFGIEEMMSALSIGS